MPWIFYERQPLEHLQQDKRVKFRVSFNENSRDVGILNRLNFKLAKFDYYGKFYGFEDLTDQLMICDKSSEEVARAYRIGTTVNF